MDVRMPELDGFDALIAIRDYSDVPVVFLTALTETFDEIKGLDLGADDYITKPFTYELLMSRINVIKRRLKLDQVFEIEGLKLDQSNHRVWIEGVEVVITLKEFEMLRLLIKHKQTLTRSQLLDQVWGYEFDGDPRTLDTHIKTLRAKLKTFGDRIKTVRGVGYRFE
jgi:DNA-binding response OmpR family regulator